MKTRLYIEGNAVDLGEGFAFPITRTFADMEDPTAMVVDYSKSVTLPRTAKNDQLFGCGGRLDFAQYGDGGVGVAFSPFKLLAVVLEYGGKVVFSGIGKLTNVTADGYTLQIEGECGRLFRELGKLVFSKNTGEENRVMYWEFDNVVEKSMDNIYQSVTTDNFWQLWDTNVFPYHSWFNTLGFFLAYNGRDDFDKTNKALNVNNGVLYDLFDDVYAATYKNSLKTFVGDGFMWYESKQIRPHHWGTYVYMIRLWQAYANEVAKLGWKLNLDDTFFNEGNPYYCNAIRLEYKQGKTLGAGRCDIECNPVSIGLDEYGGVDAGDPDTYDNGVATFLSVADSTISPIAPLTNLTDLLDLSRVEGVTKVAFDLSADLGLAGGGTYSNLDYLTLTWKPTRYGRVRICVAILDYDTNEIVTTIEMPITSEKSVTLNDPSVNCGVVRTFTWSQLFQVDLQGGKRYQFVPQLKIARQNQLFHLHLTGKYSHYDPVLGKPYFTDTIKTNIHLASEIVKINKIAVVLADYVSVSSILDGQKLQDIIFDYAKRFGLLWYADYEQKELRVMTRATAVREAKVIDGEGLVQSGWQYEPNALEGSDYYWTFDEGKGKQEKDYKDTYGVEYGGTRVVTGNEYKTADVEVVKRGRTMIEGSNTARDYGATFGTSPSLEALVRDYQLPIFESGERLQERKFTEISGVLAFRDRNYRMKDYGTTSPAMLFYAGEHPSSNHWEDYHATEILNNCTYLHCHGVDAGNYVLNTVTRNWSWLPTITLFGTGQGTWCGDFYAVPNVLSGDVPNGSYNTIYGAYWKPWNEMVMMQGKLKAKVLLKELPSGMLFVTYGGSKWLITKISDFDMNSDGVTCEMVRVQDALSGALEFSRGVKFSTNIRYIQIPVPIGQTSSAAANIIVTEEIKVQDVLVMTNGTTEIPHTTRIDGVIIDRSWQTLSAGTHIVHLTATIGTNVRSGVAMPLLVSDTGEAVMQFQWNFS